MKYLLFLCLAFLSPVFSSASIGINAFPHYILQKIDTGHSKIGEIEIEATKNGDRIESFRIKHQGEWYDAPSEAYSDLSNPLLSTILATVYVRGFITISFEDAFDDENGESAVNRVLLIFENGIFLQRSITTPQKERLVKELNGSNRAVERDE